MDENFNKNELIMSWNIIINGVRGFLFVIFYFQMIHHE